MPCNKFAEICMDSIVEGKTKPKNIRSSNVSFKNTNILVAFLKR